MLKCEVPIEVSGKRVGSLEIFAERSNFQTLFIVPEHERSTYNEAEVQLREGCTYEFKVSEPFLLKEIAKIVIPSRIDLTRGRIVPGNYVGNLALAVLDKETREPVSTISLEIRSSKLTYREDYRNMLEDISVYTSELLMQHSSPVTQTFTHHHAADSATLYQRFAFVKSLLDSEEFQAALQRITHQPVTGWKEESHSVHALSIRRVDRRVVRQFGSGRSRIPLSSGHPLHEVVPTLPLYLTSYRNAESVDTPENRFVKHALSTFADFFDELIQVAQRRSFSEILIEASALSRDLRAFLHRAPFCDVSSLSSLPLNSPVLQRKAGYREVLKAWLLFDLASKLVWEGGDDVYRAGKRDVAVLYEYWVFFRLLTLLQKIFTLSFSPAELIEISESGMSLKLKQGRNLAISGVFDRHSRRLNVEFNYNKTFCGEATYPKGGSWTRNFRPDYTLSLWPDGISAEQAEEEELIVHIHFDAKYRLDTIDSILGSSENSSSLNEETTTYRRDDLLKMHAYRDAIRRTAGAYILYPGETCEVKVGFHEVLPGLGAFAIRPNRMQTGEESLEIFLRDITQHLLNRASNRERISFRTHQIYTSPPVRPVLDRLPEPLGINRDLLPSETFVLIGYYKGDEQLAWIQRVNKYNVRTGTARGALYLTPELAAARYLLLYSAGDLYSRKLFRISAVGPRMYSRDELMHTGYPEPNHQFYLVFDIIGQPEEELEEYEWHFRELPRYSSDREGFPFTVSLTELMGVAFRAE
jgi:predicted component of viral defense system (DUF524 family)